MLGQQPLMSASHITENLASILADVSLSQGRIGRSGWMVGYDGRYTCRYFNGLLEAVCIR